MIRRSLRHPSCCKARFHLLDWHRYFNYRSTMKLVSEGAYEFWNWFDAESWHPLGRVVGGTVYPGLMFTAAAMYKVGKRGSVFFLTYG
jgi:hypothetical protein